MYLTCGIGNNEDEPNRIVDRFRSSSSNNQGSSLNGQGGKLRTDFVGLFGGGHQGQQHRPRCRNNSQAQNGAASAAAAPPRRGPSSWAAASELQFPVEIVEEDQTWSDKISCESKKKANSDPSACTNDTGYFSRAATKTSFDCILSDDSAEAFDFFEAAANSGIDFPHDDEDVVGASSSVMEAKPATRSPPFKRQRHFSLEDYNDLMDEFSSDNSNSSFNGTKQVVAAADGGAASKFPTFMHVDEFSRLSSNGSETPSAPSTPNIAGPSLTSAFRFPETTAEQKAAAGRRSSFFDASVVSMDAEDDSAFVDSVSLDTDPEHISAQLLCELKHKLAATVGGALQFPSKLLHEIAAHVIQEASPEPCGLKGCLIFIYFEGETDCRYVNTLRCDPGTTPTFELTLTLRQGQSKRHGWISSLVKRNFAFAPSVLVSTSYRLVKRRKYRLNEVEEVSLQQ